MYRRKFFFQHLSNQGDPSTGDPTPSNPAPAKPQPSGSDGDGNSGGNSSSTGTPPENGGKKGDEKPLTQEQIDSMMASRVKRERETILSDLGVSSFDEIKAFMQAKKDAEDAQKTEAEKLTEELRVEKERSKGLETQIAEMKTARINDTRNAAIKDAATALSAVDVEDVLLNVMKDAEALAQLVDEAGNVKTDAVKSAVEKVKADKPHLFGKLVPGTPSNRGGTTPNPDKKELEQAYKDNLKRARRR